MDKVGRKNQRDQNKYVKKDEIYSNIYGTIYNVFVAQLISILRRNETKTFAFYVEIFDPCSSECTQHSY